MGAVYHISQNSTGGTTFIAFGRAKCVALEFTQTTTVASVERPREYDGFVAKDETATTFCFL